MNRRVVLVLAALLLLTRPAWAEPIAMDPAHWNALGTEVRFGQAHGREAVFLREATATLEGVQFETGVIEFDLLTDGRRSFPGVRFRGVDTDNFENFYLRPHQSGNPDANQYQPVFDNSAGWQIYYGPEYSSPTRYRFNAWMRVRIEVAADSARVFIDSEAPVLEVHDLKRDRRAGFVALSDPGGGAYFSNLSITHGAIADAAPAAPAVLPSGLVRSWLVSLPIAEAAAYEIAAADRLNTLAWSRLEVESNGVANLARVAAVSEEAPTVLARVILHADRERSVRMRFGFSDRVRLFLNGAVVYDGDDTNSSRDYRFLGTVGLFDAVHLRLRRGENEIVMAISEQFGGWAAIAAFE